MVNAPNFPSRRTFLQSSIAMAFTAPLLVPQAAFAQESKSGRNLLNDKRPVIHPDGPKLGVYDPYGDFKNSHSIATEHLFLPWEDVELGYLPDADAYAHARGRNILMTIEPWSWAKEWNVSRSELSRLILSGQRDANMRAILKVVADFKSPVIIRWAQEMDNPWSRFTWSNWRPENYIDAFKRMVGIIREMLPKAQVMWSPRGEKTLQLYYPGSDYVDLVGLTVFGFEKFDKIQYGHARTFSESLKQGYELTADYNKSIWVAELGYVGDLAYLTKWVNDVTLKHTEFPRLKEVVYYNDKDTWPWPYHLGYPNWRVVETKEVTYPVRGRPGRE